ncbi:MAG TPA: biotin transporter BioY [Clostridia bacterium]|nr:biotin transporter BioY [Clostridia bacterium]
MKNKKLLKLTITAIFAALSVILSQISFTIPMTAIPFSMGIVSAFLSGALLPKYYALLSQVLYLSLGAIGLPVFSQFRGGLSVLAGPTGGYLVGYIFVAFFVAIAVEHYKKHLLLSLQISMLISLFVLYFIGTVWFIFVTGSHYVAALTTCVVPFIIPDIIKIFLAAYFSIALRKALEKSKLSVY